MFTDDDELAEILRSLRVHGEGRGKYDCVRIGLNGRFDTIQAAVLIEKLKIFPDEIAARDAIAARYSAALADVTTVPRVADGSTSVWAQYTIRVAPERREGFAATLKAQGIPTAIHYPKPVHGQSAYRHYPVAEGGAAGLRAARRGGDQPADARLSRRAGAGPHHRGGAPGAGRISACRSAAAPAKTVRRVYDGSRFFEPRRQSAGGRGHRGAMIGRIFTVGGFTLLSRITGFVRDIVLAAILGAGPIADAFFVALRLPNHFRAIFAEGAFNAAFVPAYARIRQQSGADPAKLFADRVFTLLFIVQVVLLRGRARSSRPR